ncbi:hypothetical protein [Streptomyces sp. CS014]|uniref:hypothetical protein n=1 Tax=Streptomyces sp. CS014 TaxID=2162707 RepID=UPI000D511E35|nr:hypothetical protein [Streptomyces sp. CS014]PVD04513.1 hypothetical protein DBP12_03560 [Streptomyces sp. CS014]
MSHLTLLPVPAPLPADPTAAAILAAAREADNAKQALAQAIAAATRAEYHLIKLAGLSNDPNAHRTIGRAMGSLTRLGELAGDALAYGEDAHAHIL